jgi:lauroyl/myristoyl acyltransferase
MIGVISFLRFIIIRTLERIFIPPILYKLLLPAASIRAAFKKCPPALPLPAVIGNGSVIPGTNKSWRNYYLNCTLSAFPERLAAPEWLNRCAFSGLEELLEIQRRKQPAVIVICHFGPFFLLRFWLRAVGIRAATLVGDQASERSYMNHLKDRVGLFPDIPPVFYPYQLREIGKFLIAGNVLVIAVDGNSGNQVEVPINAHFNFHMATGAMRLAVRRGARLFPCNIIDEGLWRFRVEIGRPVPEEFLSDTPDFISAGKHLLGEMLPCFRAHPEQCTKMVFESFRTVASTLAH